MTFFESEIYCKICKNEVIDSENCILTKAILITPISLKCLISEENTRKFYCSTACATP